MHVELSLNPLQVKQKHAGILEMGRKIQSKYSIQILIYHILYCIPGLYSQYLDQI